jgi:hypothetical protein
VLCLLIPVKGHIHIEDKKAGTWEFCVFKVQLKCATVIIAVYRPMYVG